MDDIKQLAALTALNAMFASGHFSICTIDKVGAMLGVDPKGDAYRTLTTLHCIDYAKMPAALRDELPTLIKQCLGVQPFYQYRLDDLAPRRADPVHAEPKRGLMRLLSFGQ